jgi:hypothetical protein
MDRVCVREYCDYYLRSKADRRAGPVPQREASPVEALNVMKRRVHCRPLSKLETEPSRASIRVRPKSCNYTCIELTLSLINCMY